MQINNKNRDGMEIYRRFPEVYAGLTQGRDFAGQCKVYNQLAKKKDKRKPVNLLELFAGPATHSAYLAQHYGHVTWQLDAVEEIRSWALQQNKRYLSPERYFLTHIPELPTGLPVAGFDLVITPGLSAGLVPFASIHGLLRNLRRFMATGGCIVFELYDLPFLQKIAFVNGDSDFISEPFQMNGHKFRYRNPGRQWLQDDWACVMSMVVELLDNNDQPVEDWLMENIEYIHTPKIIRELANLTDGWKHLPLPTFNMTPFEGTTLVVLQAV